VLKVDYNKFLARAKRWKEKSIMKNKHERLYVAVQDLLIELGITPERLRDIAANRTHGHIKPIVTSNTAQKLIAEEVNWRKPGKVLVSDKNNEVSEIDVSQIKEDHIHKKAISTFDKIKSGLPPGILCK
jgi:regulator of PEP synthase PpsR (kinase-PPPase family)